MVRGEDIFPLSLVCIFRPLRYEESNLKILPRNPLIIQFFKYNTVIY